MPVVHDTDGDLFRAFKGTGYPANIAIDKNGKYVYGQAGGISESTLNSIYSMMK